MVTQLVALLTSLGIQVIGATRAPIAKKFCQSRSCKIGRHFIKHGFLYTLESPIPLLGCDFLSKFGVTISFASNHPICVTLRFTTPDLMLTLTVPWEEWDPHQTEISDNYNHEVSRDLVPEVWTEDSPLGLQSIIPLWWLSSAPLQSTLLLSYTQGHKRLDLASIPKSPTWSSIKSW